MSLFNDNGMSPADIAAVTGNNNGNGWGFGGDGAWWLLVLFLFMFNGNNWGNGGGNNVTYNVDSAMQRGFDQSAIMSGINGINSGIAGLSQSICNGFSSAEIAANSRQMADMNQAFAAQTAMNQGFNQMSSQFANCCCENRLGLANLGADIAREACADRQAVTDAMTVLTTNMNAGFQSLKDMQFQQQLDAERRENENLRTQINMQNLAASQAAQTAQLIADNTMQTQYIVNRVAPYPIPSYTVPNPFGTATATGA